MVMFENSNPTILYIPFKNILHTNDLFTLDCIFLHEYIIII